MSISYDGLLKGALTLVAALSVNTGINNIIKDKYPNSQDTIKANLIYIFVVFTIIFIIVYLYNLSHESGFAEKLKNKLDFINPTNSKHWQKDNYSNIL